MVRAIMIVEMAGRPAEHLKAILERHVGVLNQIKDVKVHSIKISEPRALEGSPGFFTSFAEVDFETEKFGRITELIFDFLPSSVEVIEPSKVTMGLDEATSFLNNVAGRMHKYDEIARVAKVQVQQMAGRMQGMQEELMKRDAKKPAKKKAVKKKKASKKKA